MEKLFYPGSLHNHTDSSNARLRDCINKYDELINYAIELGHEVIAITDHDSVMNAVKVNKYAQKIKENNPNFKVILGNEIYLCRNGLNANNFNKTARLNFTADATSFRLFFIKTTSAASTAMSVPAPIAMPVSALVRAGASLIPSPTMATLQSFCS